MQYISSHNIYIGKLGIYTGNELSAIDKIEYEWKRSRSRYSKYNLIEIFPEAKPVILKKIKEKISFQKQELKMFQDKEEEICGKIEEVPTKDRWFWIIAAQIFIGSKIKILEKELKQNVFFLSMLRGKNPHGDKRVTPQHIERAKQVPLTNFLEVNSNGFAVCPFHINDNTPSLKYYKAQNTWWCFAENIGGDTIDFYEQKFGVKFIEAVQQLCQNQN